KRVRHCPEGVMSHFWGNNANNTEFPHLRTDNDGIASLNGGADLQTQVAGSLLRERDLYHAIARYQWQPPLHNVGVLRCLCRIITANHEGRRFRFTSRK